MANRSLRFQLRRRSVDSGSLPTNALFGEPFINDYNGILRFSGVTGGDYEESDQVGIFEVGSRLYNSKVTNRLSVNDNWIVSGDTGILSTYAGVSGAGLDGKFMSGTTFGFVLADIADIQGQAKTFVQEGSNITTGGTADEPIINVVDNPSFNNISFSGLADGNTVYTENLRMSSGATNGYVLASNANGDARWVDPGTFAPDATLVQDGINTFTGGTSLFPSVNVTGLSIDNITVSGEASFDGITANTISSGATNLYDIFAPVGGGDITRVQEGNNIVTGGTDNLPTINLVDSPSVDNITSSGTGVFNNIISNEINSGIINTAEINASSISGDTIYSAGTDLYNIFSTSDNNDVTRVQPGSNITTGGTDNLPIVSLTDDVFVNDITVSGTGEFAAITSGGTDLYNIFLSDNGNLTPGLVPYVDAGGDLTTESGFAYDENENILSAPRIVVGDPSTTGETTATVYGNILLIGDAISGFTSELYIEDNRIELNFNPTADTTSTSLGAGWSIQDGSGIDGTDVFLDIRGTSTGLGNRSFTTNLEDFRIRESGTLGSPNGKRVIAEDDILDGGSY